jgi:hypothetical protein
MATSLRDWEQVTGAGLKMTRLHNKQHVLSLLAVQTHLHARTAFVRGL